jgi:hypothetical protein
MYTVTGEVDETGTLGNANAGLAQIPEALHACTIIACVPDGGTGAFSLPSQ